MHCHFRTKYLQVIDLISNDDFLFRHNISAPMDDFREVLYDFPKFYQYWHYKHGGWKTIRSYAGTWQKIFAIKLSEILTRWGLCYTFNILKSADMISNK